MMDFQDTLYDFTMFFKRFCEDEYVVHVNHHNPFINEFLTNVIHHCLKGFWVIFQPKEHDQRFVQATICLKGCLPLISLFYAHIVVALANIKFGEAFGFDSSNFFHDVWYER